MFAWWGYNYIAWNIQMCTYSRSSMAFIGTHLFSLRLLIYFLPISIESTTIITCSQYLNCSWLIQFMSMFVNKRSWVQIILHVTMTWIRLYAYCTVFMYAFIYLEINVLPLSFKGWSTMINGFFCINWYVQKPQRINFSPILVQVL